MKASKEDAVKIELSTRVKKSPNQVSCNLDGEVAILNLKSSLYFGLDAVGVAVWDKLSEPRQVSQICQVITDQFDVSEQRCQADVIVLLSELNKAGLIEIEA